MTACHRDDYRNKQERVAYTWQNEHSWRTDWHNCRVLRKKNCRQLFLSTQTGHLRSTYSVEYRLFTKRTVRIQQSTIATDVDVSRIICNGVA